MKKGIFTLATIIALITFVACESTAHLEDMLDTTNGTILHEPTTTSTEDNDTHENPCISNETVKPREPDPTPEYGYAIKGYFITAAGGKKMIILTEDGKAVYDTDYGYVEVPPWNKPVSFDGIENGDLVCIYGQTVFESIIPVFDISEIELIEKGALEDIEESILNELSDLGIIIVVSP